MEDGYRSSFTAMGQGGGMPHPAEPTGRLVPRPPRRDRGSRTGRHTGTTDIPLTADEERDARRLGDRLAAFDLELVLPHRSPAPGAPPSWPRSTGLDDDLVEWDYGGYEGRTTKEIRETLGDPTWTVFDDGVARATPGETVEEVAARASRVLTGWPPAVHERDVALFAHGHYLRILAATFLRQDARSGPASSSTRGPSRPGARAG